MKKIETFVLRTIAGESILVPTGKTTLAFNGMITLSETAAFIWENLENAESAEALATMMTSEFSVDKETVLADIQEFTDQLIQAKMVAYTDPDKKW